MGCAGGHMLKIVLGALQSSCQLIVVSVRLRISNVIMEKLKQIVFS